MTYYGAKELAASFRTVRKNTIVVAEEIAEENYGYRITPDTRTVAQTLVHIAVTPRIPERIHWVERRSTLEGFNFFGLRGEMIAEEKTVRSKAQILEMLRAGGEKYAGMLEKASEEFLAERVVYPQGMMPPSKSRFEMVMSPKEHEMHHRGQLMVVERLLGMVPHLTRDMQARIAAMQASEGKP